MSKNRQESAGTLAGEDRELIAAILETVGALVVVLDTEGRIVRFNRACEQVTGYSEQEVHGRFLWDLLLAPEQVEPVKEVFGQLRAGQFPNAFENFWVCKDGSRRLIAWSNTAIADRAGNVKFVVGTGIDVTRHRQLEEAAERALAEARRRQVETNALLKASRAVLEHQDFDGAARSIFASAKELTGATAGYVALLTPDGAENDVLFLDSGGLPCTVDPLLPMPIRGLRAEAYRIAKPVYENDFPNSVWNKYLPQGHVRLENALFAPLIVEGAVAGLMGLSNKPGGFTQEDVHFAGALGELAAIALKNSRMRDLVESSERRFRTLTQTASDAIICADHTGAITFWNDGAQRMFGYTPAAVLGKPLTLIMPERFRSAHAQALQDLAAGGSPRLIGRTVQLAGQRMDGAEFPLELSLASWTTKEGVFFTGIVRDVTERRRAEEALQKAHDKLSAVLESITDAFFSLDREFRLTYVNHEAEMILRQPRQEMLGKNLWDLFPEAVGSRFEHEYERAMAENRTAHFEEFYPPFGQWFDVHAYPSEVGLSVYFTDITERKRTEKQLAASAARLTRANQELEHFAYVASHDLQEPLRMVSSFLKLLSERYGPQLDEKAREYIGYSVDGATRMSNLIRDLLEYSRADRADKESCPVDANQCLAAAVANLHGAISESGATMTNDALPTVMVDRTKLSQLLQNLIGNAIKFRRKDQPCQVHVGAEHREGQWVIFVRDNGIGIDPQQHDRIFEIFQRLHSREQFPGTGIGLAICKRIVERHGGRIWVESKPGEGSTFYFTIPEDVGRAPKADGPGT